MDSLSGGSTHGKEVQALNAPSDADFFVWKVAREKNKLLDLYTSSPETKINKFK